MHLAEAAPWRVGLLRDYAALYARSQAIHDAFAQFAASTRRPPTNSGPRQGKLTLPVLAIGGDKSYGASLANEIRYVATDVTPRSSQATPCHFALIIVTCYGKITMATPPRNRGRPPTGKALSAAERMRRLRQRRQAAGLKLQSRWVEGGPSTAPYSDHRRLDLRSLAMHTLIARKLALAPGLLAVAGRMASHSEEALARGRSIYYGAGSPRHSAEAILAFCRRPYAARAQAHL